MNRLDRFIAYFSPVRALKRERARQGIEAYKAAGSSRLSNLRREGRDPNSPVKAAAVSLREKARTLEQDNDIARHALDILVQKSVGTGLLPEPMVRLPDGAPHVSMNERLSDLYMEWAETAESTQSHDNQAAQRIAARTLFRDGEVFYQHIQGNVANFRHGSRIPYSFELMEPDLIPHDYNEGGVMQGIAINGWRQPQAYFVYTDYLNTTNAFLLPSQIGQQTVRVEAERMEHLALRDRIAQLRGVSKFASVILRFDDIGEIEESERVAARVAAAMCAVIVKGNADDWTANAPDGQRNLKWQPGQIFDDLLPGERVESMASNRPNNQVIEFRDANMRAAAGGVGVGYSGLANDYEGSYSSQRQELVEQEVAYDILSDYLIARMEKPKYRRFVQMAIAAGLVPEWRQADAETLTDVWYAAPAMPWVDPQKEMTALKTALEIRMTSLSRAQRERGLSPREVLRERALEAEAERMVIGEPEPPAVTTDDDEDDDEGEEGQTTARVRRLRNG